MSEKIKTSHKIIIGDARNMDDISDKSVQLIITSPPYWQLKDYGTPNQLGYYDSYQDYINNLNLVWNECNRVLENGCRLCINIGDQFARSVYYGRYKVIPIRTEIIKFCETIGLDYFGSIIWQKVTTTNTSGGASIMGSFPYPRNGVVKIDYEFILIFKKYGTSNKVPEKIKKLSALTKDEWNKYFYGHWNFSGERQDKHLAMFPEELPKRLIKMFSFIGDTILDPFLGSGTTTLAAKNNNRNSIGYEINPKYLETIKEKVGVSENTLFEDHSFHFIEKKNEERDYKLAIQQLPYVFSDPVKLSRKINPKKVNFGSKIDDSQKEKENNLTVRKVIDPVTVVLSNGKPFKLLGIKIDNSKKNKATEFLKDLVLGKRVAIQFDHFKLDKNSELIGYLHLQNKTFVNLHMVKSNLVNVNEDYEYKYLQKFKMLEGK